MTGPPEQSGGRRVWVTRAQPGADATARRLREHGFTPLVAPVLEVRALAATIELHGVGALAFTSANGVRAFAALSAARDLPVFTVGDATGEAAHAAGFGCVASADGDVADLAALITDRGVAGEVLHLRGRDAAGDLTAELVRRGAPARAVILYETVALQSSPQPVLGASPGLEAVLIHSPKAARALARLFAEAARRGELSRLEALALSPACAAPLEGLGLRLRVAERPREDALLALLDP